ncbi:MAG: hypothetical protein U5L08_16690 [Xanthomonadales bacterium]|nr:hypothetical protein [Xanthomonadales bacterium]
MRFMAECFADCRSSRLDPIPDGGVLRVAKRFTHAGPDGIEVDVGHARQHGLFVEQRLALETAFPELARAAFLTIGHAGNRLVERALEPANRAKALADDIQAFGIAQEGEGGPLYAGQIVTIADRAWKDRQPTLCDFAICPLPSRLRVAAKTRAPWIRLPILP